MTGFLNGEAQCPWAPGPLGGGTHCSSGTHLGVESRCPGQSWECFASNPLAKSGPGNQPWPEEGLGENYVTYIKTFPFWNIAPCPPAFETLFGPFGWKMDGIFQHDHFTVWKLNFFFVFTQIFHLLLRFCQWDLSFTLRSIYTVLCHSLGVLS